MDRDAHAHYELGIEDARLRRGPGLLELRRTQEVLRRHLPPPPARVLDVGGGTGIHASWLAADGYSVHLVDPMELHVRQALEHSAGQSQHPFTASLGDARALDAADASFDAVLLMGPLYHLTSEQDRLTALREARRVTRPGGLVAVAAVSHFASLLDSMARGHIRDPAFRQILLRDLRDGQHRNPGGRPDWFTTAFFHRPDELLKEMAQVGLEIAELVGVEGPAWLMLDFDQRWEDPGWRESMLFAARAVEAEPAMLSLSAHLLAVGRRPPDRPGA